MSQNETKSGGSADPLKIAVEEYSDDKKNNKGDVAVHFHEDEKEIQKQALLADDEESAHQNEPLSSPHSSDNLSPVDSTERLAQKLSKMSETQKKFYFFFQEPTGLLAHIFQAISYSLLLLFTIMFLLESLPEFTSKDGYNTSLNYIFFPLETLLTIWWTIEFCGRFYACTEKSKFFTKFQNIVDVVTIVPYFISFIDDRTAKDVARILRLLRLAKILQLAKYSIGVQLAAKAVRRSGQAILTLFTFLIASSLVASTLMFWAERGTWDAGKSIWISTKGNPSPFQSIPEGFYWAIVTLSTVGYGDVVPITPWGKFVACLTMVFSILVLALPISILGQNFKTEWDIYQRCQMQRKMQKLQRQRQRHEELEVSKTNNPSGIPGLSSGQQLPQHHSGKVKNSQLIFEQNVLMLQALEEIQEQISLINPPQYYRQFKETSLKLEKARDIIADLEAKNKKLKRDNDFLTKLHHEHFSRVHEEIEFDGLPGSGESIRSLPMNRYQQQTLDADEHSKRADDDFTDDINHGGHSKLKQLKAIVKKTKGKHKKANHGELLQLASEPSRNRTKSMGSVTFPRNSDPKVPDTYLEGRSNKP